MAKPIEEVSIQEFQAKSDSADEVSQLLTIERSLRSLSSIVQSLESSGLLKMLTAFVEHYEDALRVIVDQTTKESASNALHNLLLGYDLLSRLDNQRLSSLASSVSDAMDSMDKFKAEPPLGIMALMRAVKEPDVSAGMRAMLKILGSLAKTP